MRRKRYVLCPDGKFAIFEESDHAYKNRMDKANKRREARKAMLFHGVVGLTFVLALIWHILQRGQ